MGDLSNKSLAFLLLASVMLSIIGTFLVLNKIDGVDGVTGFAASGTGIVNLSVSTTMSITTNESSLVNFGACTLNGSNPIFINSMAGENTSQYCVNYAGTNVSNISVRNDGNVIVNVSIATSACAPGAGNTSCTFLNKSTAPSTAVNGLFQYQTTNAGRLGYTGGCTTPNTSWNSFNGTHGVHACTNLASAVTANSFVADFRLRLPNGLGTGVQSATITFTASQP